VLQIQYYKLSYLNPSISWCAYSAVDLSNNPFITFIPNADVDLVNALYLHLVLWILICIINASVITFRLIPHKREIRKVKCIIFSLEIRSYKSTLKS